VLRPRWAWDGGRNAARGRCGAGPRGAPASSRRCRNAARGGVPDCLVALRAGGRVFRHGRPAASRIKEEETAL